MDQTLLAMAAAFVAGAVFGYMVREGVSRRRRARERQRFFYDNEPYGEATLLPDGLMNVRTQQGSKVAQPE